MPATLTEDALNRYRITHPDRDLRPLLRRIHRLPRLANDPTSADATNLSTSGVDTEEAQRERELTRLEVIKWKMGIERVLACARNLERQAGRYRSRAEATTARAAELESTLEDEKRLLAQKLQERDHQIKCDEVYARITARPKTREELEEQIASLRSQIDSHQASYSTYVSIVQQRIDAFAGVMPIIDTVRKTKLPKEVFPVDDETPSTIMDDAAIPTGPKETSTSGESDRHHLSGAALPFTPAASSSSTTATATSASAPTRSSLPPPLPPPAGPSGGRSTSHALPSRPSRKSPSLAAPSSPGGTGRQGGRAASANLPNRPSGLRKSVTPGRGLEEGEVEGEEGEIGGRDGRNVRQRR